MSEQETPNSLMVAQRDEVKHLLHIFVEEVKLMESVVNVSRAILNIGENMSIESLLHELSLKLQELDKFRNAMVEDV